MAAPTTDRTGATVPTTYLPAVRKLAERQWEARLDQTDDKYAYPPAYEVYEVIGVYVTRDEAIGQAQRRYRELGGK